MRKIGWGPKFVVILLAIIVPLGVLLPYGPQDSARVVVKLPFYESGMVSFDETPYLEDAAYFDEELDSSIQTSARYASGTDPEPTVFYFRDEIRILVEQEHQGILVPLGAFIETVRQFYPRRIILHAEGVKFLAPLDAPLPRNSAKIFIFHESKQKFLARFPEADPSRRLAATQIFGEESNCISELRLKGEIVKNAIIFASSEMPFGTAVACVQAQMTSVMGLPWRHARAVRMADYGLSQPVVSLLDYELLKYFYAWVMEWDPSMPLPKSVEKSIDKKG